MQQNSPYMGSQILEQVADRRTGLACSLIIPQKQIKGLEGILRVIFAFGLSVKAMFVMEVSDGSQIKSTRKMATPVTNTILKT